MCREVARRTIIRGTAELRPDASQGSSSGFFPVVPHACERAPKPVTGWEPADGAWCLRRTATRSPWRTVMTGTATVSPGGTSRDARVQAREVSIPGPSPADAGTIRRMLRRRGYHRAGPPAEAESAVFGVIPVTTDSLPHGAFHRADDAPGAEGRSARTLRACNQNVPGRTGKPEHIARLCIVPASHPTVLPCWQRPWPPAAHSPHCPEHHRLRA